MLDNALVDVPTDAEMDISIVKKETPDFPEASAVPLEVGLFVEAQDSTALGTEEVNNLPTTSTSSEEVNIVPTASTSTEDDASTFLNRKRKRREDSWKSVKAKEALNLGLEHVNVRGKLIPAKQMKSPCVCNKDCRFKMSTEERLEVHKAYWNLGSKVDQWNFIGRHSSCSNVKSRTTSKDKSRRNSSRKYFFFVGPEKRQVFVCKTMFVRTLTIGDSVIQTAYRKLKDGECSPDKRGKHENRPRKTSEERKVTIRAHIALYPRIPPIYVDASNHKEYIEWGMSVNKMFRHYELWCEENCIPRENRATRRQYRDLFNQTNIEFFRPFKRNQCGLCNLMKKGTTQEREIYKERWISHIHRKQAARKKKHASKILAMDRTDVAVLTFALQKVLPCPKVESPAFSYKNKLSLFNLTMYEVVEHEVICYLWHEGIGKRGANEIGSVIFNCISLCVENGIKEIHSFSDTCAGQTKNRYFYAMLLLAAAKHSIKIRHTFLEPGHSLNEGDIVHSRIENAALRKDIYDMQEWVDHIQGARREEPRFSIKFLQRTSIFDFYDLVSRQNWETDSEGRKILWNRVRIVEANGVVDSDSDELGVLRFKYEYNDNMLFLDTTQWKGRKADLKTYSPPLAYGEKIPIKKTIVDHLMELCEKQAIPFKYHAFYQSVFSQVNPIDNEIPLNLQVIEDSHDVENDVISSKNKSSNLNSSVAISGTSSDQRNNIVDQNVEDMIADVSDDSDFEEERNGNEDDSGDDGSEDDGNDDDDDHPNNESDSNVGEDPMKEALKFQGRFEEYLLSKGYISFYQ